MTTPHPLRRLSTLDGDSLVRVVLAGFALSVIAVLVGLAALLTVLTGLGRKADKASEDALATQRRLGVSVCALAYLNGPYNPQAPARSTAAGKYLANGWGGIYDAARCAAIPRAELLAALGLEDPQTAGGNSPPASSTSPTATPTRTPSTRDQTGG